MLFVIAWKCYYNYVKSLANLIKEKKQLLQKSLDSETVFFVFRKVIKEEMGNVGLEKLIPSYFSGQKLFIKAQSPAWGSELWLNKAKIIRKMNQEFRKEVVVEIKLKSS